MNMNKLISAILLSAFSFGVFAEGSTHHSGQASKHSVLAVTEGLAGSAKVGSAVVAVPVLSAGAVSLAAGSMVVEAGESIAESHANHGPLVITERTITVDPAPDQVIIIQNNKTDQE